MALDLGWYPENSPATIDFADVRRFTRSDILRWLDLCESNLSLCDLGFPVALNVAVHYNGAGMVERAGELDVLFQQIVGMRVLRLLHSLEFAVSRSFPDVVTDVAHMKVLYFIAVLKFEFENNKDTLLPSLRNSFPLVTIVKILRLAGIPNDRVLTKQEISTLLIIGAIESNPGYVRLDVFVGLVHVGTYRLTARSFASLSKTWSPWLVKVSSSYEGVYNLMLASFDLLPAPFRTSVVKQSSKQRFNSAKRKKLNARAFDFDQTDPFTWKFDHVEAYSFLVRVKDHVFMQSHDFQWVADKMMMRRGVALSDAFAMVCERYAEKRLPLRLPPHVSPTHEMPPAIEDVPPQLAVKMAFGVELNSRDRRMVFRVQKQAGFLNLGIVDSLTKSTDFFSKSVASASSNVSESVALHGAAVSSGLRSMGSSFEDSVGGLSRALDSFGEKLSDVRVTHQLGGTLPMSENLAKYLDAVPAPLMQFIEIVRDILPMLVSDDPLVAAACQPLLLSRYGVLTSVLIDAVVLTLKQLMKVFRPNGVVKQNLKDPVNEHVATTMYTVIYGLVFGKLPEGTLGNLKDRVAGLNGIATLLKNGVSFGHFLVDAFKYVANWIYESVYGFPYFDSETKKLLLTCAELDARVTSILEKDEVVGTDMQELSRLRGEVSRVVVLLVSANLKDESIRMRKLQDSIGDFQSFESLPAFMREGKPPTAMFRLVSEEGGKGKSLLASYITGACWHALGWPGNSPLDCEVQYRYDFNFQDKITPNSRFLIIDDPFNVQDDAVIKKVLNELYEQGNPRPKKREGASLADKESMFEMFEICGVFDNGARSDLPNNNDGALARRFDIGIFNFEVKKEFQTKQRRLIVERVTEENLDDVWTFTSTSDGTVLNFWQFIAHIVRAVKRNRDIHRKTLAQVARLGKLAKELPPVPFIAPAVKFTKQAFYTPSLEFENKVGLSEKQLRTIAQSLNLFGDLRLADPVALSQELGVNAADTVESVMAQYGKAIKNMGKQKEGDVVKSFVVRGDCLFVENVCEKHKCCPNRVHEPQELEPIELEAVKAAHGHADSWRIRFFETAKSWGLVVKANEALSLVLKYAVNAAAVAAVGSILSSLFGRFFSASPVASQAYSTTYAMNPQRSAQRVGALPSALAVEKQYNLTNLQPSTSQWLYNLVGTNTVPFAVPLRDRQTYAIAHLFCVESNLHYTTKHSFLDEPVQNKVSLFGDVACMYELRILEWSGWHVYDEIDDGKPVVWVLPFPGFDLAFVVTPRSGMIRPDITKFLAKSGCPLSSFMDVSCLLKPYHEIQTNDDHSPKVSKFIPSVPHFMGDVVDSNVVDAEDGSMVYMARCPNRTPNGSCGSPWITANTRVPGGIARICAIQQGYYEGVNMALGSPIWFEFHVQAKSCLPPRKRNLSVDPRVDIPLNGGEIAANVVAVATMPKKQGANQNLKNDIKRSPAYDILVGLEVYDAATKQNVIVPPPGRVPVDLRDPVRALGKMPLSPTIMDERTLEDYREAAAHTLTKVLSPLDEKFWDRLFVPTLGQVLNGVAELDIPGIDMTTSAGYRPPLAGRPGKADYCYEVSPGTWGLKSEFVLLYEQILEKMREGVMPLPVVVDNGKVELRPPVKPPRNTSCYEFLVLLAAKTVLFWLPVAIKYGRVKNGTLYGVDLNSTEGSAVYTKLEAHKYKDEGDYVNFDASIQPDQTQVANEDVLLPLMQEIRAHGGSKESDICFLAALRVQTFVLHMFGVIVYVRWFGNTSGGFITTPFNCIVGLNNQHYCFLVWFKKSKQSGNVWEVYEATCSCFVYGDDYTGSTDFESYDNLEQESSVAALGQKTSPAVKGTSFTPHVVRNSILKSTPWVEGRYVHWRLDLEVLAEVHAFIRDHSISRLAATRVNMDAALRMWFHVSKDAFEKVRHKFNMWLASQGGAPILMTYLDLKVENEGKYNQFFPYGNTLPKTGGGVVKQSLHASMRVFREGDRRRDVRPVRHAGLYNSGVAFWALNKHSFKLTTIVLALVLTSTFMCTASSSTNTNPQQNAVSTSTQVTEAGAPRMNDNPVTSETALTTWRDDTVVIDTNPKVVTPAPIAQTDPYPDQGMREVLSRPYRVQDLSWPSSAAVGTLLATLSFPEALFAIPNIQNKLSSFRYFKGGVKVAFRVNANSFAGGTLMIGYIPFYDPAQPNTWRHKYQALAQAGPSLLSASRADTLEITIPWISPFAYRDLRSANNVGMIGTVFVYVMNPLVFSVSGAPTSLSVSIFANFVEPQVAGPDINGAPAAFVTKQSGEAFMKSVKGVVSGVPAAVRTVSGLIKPFSEAAGAVLSFLDKPTSVAANTNTTPFPNKGMSNAHGLDQSEKLALDPNAQVSVESSIFAGSNSRPSWKEVLGCPSLIFQSNFTQAAAADSVIAAWPVRPNYARLVAGVYYPGALAYYSMLWRRWRGGIKYGIHFACPSNVTARVRISFLPNVTALTAPPENQAGDVFSKVVSITGDTFISFPVEYLADTHYKTCEDISTTDTDDTNAIGRVVITVLNEVVSVNTAVVTPIAFTVWMAACPNFKFSKPDDLPSGWSPNFSVGVPRVRKQSSIRDLMAKQADGLVPTTLLEERGLVTPEDFTGPIDLLKRQTYRSTANPSDVYVVQPANGTTIQYILLPFLGWRGGWRYKFFWSDTSDFPYGWQRVRWNPAEEIAGGGMPFLSGVTYQQVNISPWLEVECPFYDKYSWRETWPVMTVDNPDSIEYYAIKYSGLAPANEVYESVADDFSLGPFMGCPPLTITGLKGLSNNNGVSSSKGSVAEPSPYIENTQHFG